MVVPFGTFEHILKDPLNADVAKELAALEAGAYTRPLLSST
jgi:hypothetical protein